MEEILKNEYDVFVQNVENKNAKSKKLFHFNSVLNAYNELMNSSNEELNTYKQKLLYFFYELSELEYELNNRHKSVELFREYLKPIGVYLIRKRKFTSRTSLHVYIIIGIIIDFALIYFIDIYKYPIFSLFSIILGLVERRNAIKNMRYISIFW